MQPCEFSNGLPSRQLVVSPQFLVDGLAAPGSIGEVADQGRPRLTPEQRATPARPARQAQQARYPSLDERRSPPSAGASASQRRAVLAKAPPWTTACWTRLPPTSAGQCWKSAAPWWPTVAGTSTESLPCSLFPSCAEFVDGPDSVRYIPTSHVRNNAGTTKAI